MKPNRIVSQEEWLKARKELLAREKELTHLRDALSAQRRELPWVRVEKEYVFETSSGKKRLADLFEGRSQLFIYHFMFGPGWSEGCKSCSYLADHFDGAVIHLAHRDVTLTAVSRATLPEIDAFKKRMGWRFNWASSFGTDFNFDYQVSFQKDDLAQGKVYYNYSTGGFAAEEAPGMSVFFKDETGDVYHTYSCYARGTETLVGTYGILDLVPKGRDEDGLAFTMAWVRHHDRYDQSYSVNPVSRYDPPEGSIARTLEAIS